MIYDNNKTFKQNILAASGSDNILESEDQKSIWPKGSGEIIIPEGMILRNMTLKYPEMFSLVPYGNHIRFENVKLYTQGHTSDTAIIELLDTKNFSVDRLEIFGDNNRKAILCRSSAVDTVLRHLSISGNIGFGILFNDSIREQGRDYRTIKGVDYSDRPVASGISIQHYNFGYVGMTRAGDGIEMNAPDEGISSIDLDSIFIHSTLTSSSTASNGIGLGFANCTDVKLNKAIVNNTGKFGIHFEKGANHDVTNFSTHNSKRALSVAHTENTTFSKGVCTNSEELFISYNTLNDRNPCSKTTLKDVDFYGFTDKGIWSSNSESIELINVSIDGHFSKPSQPYIKLYQQDPDLVRIGCKDFSIENLAIGPTRSGYVDHDILIHNSQGNITVPSDVTLQTPIRIKQENSNLSWNNAYQVIN